MKSQISATLDQTLLDWIDTQIATQKFRNRSHALEYALMKLKAQEENKPVFKMLKTEDQEDNRG